ncbi:hypothetical protein BDQ17DRAFT_1330639 [Cyathus striatus]|nr:hypothetical protein BDQ17DRAFT_1330639 [Cyathus striatus]
MTHRSNTQATSSYLPHSLPPTRSHPRTSNISVVICKIVVGGRDVEDGKRTEVPRRAHEQTRVAGVVGRKSFRTRCKTNNASEDTSKRSKITLRYTLIVRVGVTVQRPQTWDELFNVQLSNDGNGGRVHVELRGGDGEELVKDRRKGQLM